MFEKGEYISYGHSGICRVEDITRLDIPGVDRKKLYYVLVPLNIKGSRIYYPVDKEKVRRYTNRPCIPAITASGWPSSRRCI